MSYIRVLPRDAFNEGNLLKCIGMLTLKIEDGLAPDWAYRFTGESFIIQQNQGDGSLVVANIEFIYKGRAVIVFRPLNARELYPLYAQPYEGDEFKVFDEFGRLS